MMAFLLIVAAGIGATLCVNLLLRNKAMTRADLAIGTFAGLLSFGLLRLFANEGIRHGWGLPLVAAAVIALGLKSYQQREAEREA